MRIHSFSSDKDILKELGARLKMARIATDLTQQQLADKIGVSRMTISALEKDGKGTLQTLIRALRGLGHLDRLEVLLDEPTPGPMMMEKFLGTQRTLVRHASKEKK